MVLLLLGSCAKKPPPAEEPTPPVVTEPEPPPPPPEIPEEEVSKEEITQGDLQAIHFDFDRYDLRSGDREILNRNAAMLREYPAARIRIEGNCDERGTVEYNLALGEKRARAAKDYLVNLGINPDRI
ncbi:MAG: OmpA family protein, partial [Armatimonadetes bacterium]|nr:OmpA family protein [Armatimonadota bacterium]NIO96663.1 OmpA family protein [Armatimonadota bacterium]